MDTVKASNNERVAADATEIRIVSHWLSVACHAFFTNTLRASRAFSREAATDRSLVIALYNRDQRCDNMGRSAGGTSLAAA